jgi:predicted CoA-substrate-specific enzyme activase
MIGYLCKYTPIELFAGFGETTKLLSPAPANTQEAAVHPCLCSYAKAVCAGFTKDGARGIVFTNCCDSVKRAGDILKDKAGFSFMLNLPRIVTPASAALFAKDLSDLIQSYEQYSGAQFDIAAFKDAFAAEEDGGLAGKNHIALIGARAPAELTGLLAALSPLPIRDLTCTGQSRVFGTPPETDEREELFAWYASALLAQPPCMRMQDVSGRRALWRDPHTKGFVYHTIQFCDYYGFEYAAMKNETPLPVLKLETDFTGAADGQLRTRIEAFFESLPAPADAAVQKTGPGKAGKIYAGVDSGSTSTDVVLLSEDLHILSSSIYPTAGRAEDSAAAALSGALAKIGASKEDIAEIVSTGYGRNAIRMGEPVTEITCHAKGAYFMNAALRTIIDIGGQDSKIIKLDDAGNIIDFSMNDKCAAGTGRFLEMMAGTLGMPLDDFARAGLKWKEDIRISSMCSVFAESEVISLIAQNKKKPDIIHGINQSITARIHAMITRLACGPAYMMTGGVAKNKGVVGALSGRLSEKIYLPDEPQICGALGAALIAAEKKYPKLPGDNPGTPK